MITICAKRNVFDFRIEVILQKLELTAETQRMRFTFPLVMLIFYFSCSQDNLQDLPENFELYIEENDAYSVVKPVDWNAEKRTEPDGRTYLVLTSPDDASGHESNVSIITADAAGKSIGEYTQILMSSYIQLFKTFDLESRDTLRINDVKFGSFVIKGNLERKTYRMNTVYTIRDGRLYQINALAPGQRYENDKAVMDQIISSFKITK